MEKLLLTRLQWIPWLLASCFIGLLLLLPYQSQAQLYYVISDSNLATTADQLRRVNLDGSNNILIKDNFIQSPGATVLDVANNRVLVANIAVTNADNPDRTRIIAVGLGAGNPVNTLVTAGLLAGATTTQITGMALDAVNGYLYYVLNDGNLATTADQLRRVNLDGSNNILIKENFIQSPGNIVLDAANNRILVANIAVTNADNPDRTRIVAVGLGTGNPVSTLVTAGLLAGATTTQITGLALDAVNRYLYYVLNDGALATTADQLRRVNLDGSNNILIKDNFIQSPGTLVLDVANNRILVNNAAVTNAANPDRTRIIAVGLGAGNPVSTLVTAGLLPGATTTQITGMAIVNQTSPTVTTTSPASNITPSNATVSGSIVSDGGSTLTDYGVVYVSGNGSPTTSNTKIQVGTNSPTAFPSTFSASLTGLTPGTTYTARAYATNSIGTSYGQTVSLTTPPQAPILVSPANGSLLTTRTPAYTGTAQAGSTVTVYVDGSNVGTTMASNGGNFVLVQPTSLPDNAHTVRATATLNGATSANSNTNTFSIDATPPTVSLTSSAGASGTSTGSLPLAFTATFSESVSNFIGSDLAIANGTLAGFAGSGRVYSFSVSPSAEGLVSVSIAAGVASDVAGNLNTASNLYRLTYQQPVTVTPVLTTPPNGGVVGGRPVFSGTAPASSTVTLYLTPSGSATQSLTTVTATGGGTFSYTPSTTLTSGSYSAYATAQSAGMVVSGTSNVNSFTVDAIPPTVVITSSAGVAGSSTSVRPLSFIITFSEPVTDFTFIDVAFLITNVSSATFATLSSTTYRVLVTPRDPGAVGFYVPANSGYDAAGNGNVGIGRFSINYAPNQAPTDVSLSNTSVAENAAVGTLVGTLSTTDADMPAQSFSYSLVSGAGSDDNASFTLSGNSLLTASAFDFETKSTYSIRVRTTDSGNPGLSYEKVLIISVTNINELAVTVVSQTNVTCFGGNNGAATVSASGENGPFSYQWSPGNPAGNGTPTVTGLAAGSYSVIVTATSSGFATTTVVTISQPAALVVSVSPSATVVCGGTVSLRATTSASNPSFVWTGTSPTSGPVVTVSSSGLYSVTVTDATGCTATANATVTINPIPTVSITGLASDFCQDAAPVTLQGSPTGGVFTIDQVISPSLTPSSLSVGAHTVVYRYADANGCSNTASQVVTIKAVPPTPTLLTQSGQTYPGGRSAVTVDVNSGTVNLLVGGCSGAVNWSGPNNTTGTTTTINVPTTAPGSFVYQASCTANGCTSLLASATVTVGGRLTVLHRDVDNYPTNNAIQPLLVLQNNGSGALPYSGLTLRYYLTVEGNAALSNLSVNYAQVGNGNVKLRYVPLSPAQAGASGYVEYSFTAGAGSLAAGASSGPIQGYFTKADYGSLNELDDYSYALVRDQLVGNPRITAYYNGVLIAGQEPGNTTPIRALRALTESKNGPSATQINTYLVINNEGTVAVNYSDLKARYYFTSDGNERLQVEVDEGNVRTQLVRLAQPVGGADTYLEITFNQAGQLAPGASTGRIRYRISKPDGGRFNQANDYSYQEQPAESSSNSRVVVFVGQDRVWGNEPTGSARMASAEPMLELEVTVLGNPVRGDVVSVQIKGAGSEPLQLQLVSAQGRVIAQRQVASPQAVEQHELSVAGQGPGVLLLQVSTPTQSRTIRVLKAD